MRVGATLYGLFGAAANEQAILGVFVLIGWRTCDLWTFGARDPDHTLMSFGGSGGG
jgi:hypothetical protein